ncbi:MAG TPA: protein kinase [Solirubrobacteraceae bacterium]|nr:protein kinase [Solirubrobacteraceae bacterium]
MTEEHVLAGTTLAAYRIDGLIGHGGMGDVFLAHDTRLGRPVALKVLADRLAGDERFSEQLLRESQVAASLDHPNVVPIYDAGDADGRLFIAMRYVHGLDLKALLRAEGALAPDRAVAIAAQVASALDAAHRRGLVHRDVKPSNILLDRQDGREHAYLADFGLVQSVDRSSPADGQFMGTVDYVAPEQIRGEPVDGRADQYALGCLLFECLTGSLPFRHGSDVAAIYAHLEEPPPRASERREGLRPAVDHVLQRAMAKDPGERFATCGELVDEARTALALDGTRRRRWLVPALGLLTVAIAAAAITIALGGGEKTAAPGPSGTLVRIDPRTNRVARTEVPGYPGPVEVTAGGVWVGDFRQGVLWRYDPATGVKQRIPSNGEPRDLAASGSDVYVVTDIAKDLTAAVSRYDAVTGLRKDSVNKVPICAITSGEGVVWAAGCPYVDRLSTGPGKLRWTRTQFLPFQAPGTSSNARVQFRELTIGAGSLWVLGDALDRRMWRLDARSGDIEKTIVLPFPPRSAVVAGGAVWITDPLHDTVVPVDIASNRVLEPVAVGHGASGVAAAGGGVWVANTIDGTVSRVDPRERRVTATIPVGGSPSEIAAGRGAVWVTSHEL